MHLFLYSLLKINKNIFYFKIYKYFKIKGMKFDLFRNSNQTLEDIQEYIQTRTDDPNLFESDVQDEDNLDDWSIDDFLVALPKSIKYGINDILFNLTITYGYDDECIICYENKDLGKSILEVRNINSYDAFKEIYMKLKTINKLD